MGTTSCHWRIMLDKIIFQFQKGPKIGAFWSTWSGTCGASMQPEIMKKNCNLESDRAKGLW